MGRWWTGRRLAALVVCSGLISGLAACDTGTPSALNADENVLVHGRLVGPNGKVVARTRVALYRQPGAEEAVGNAFAMVATLGLACLADNGPQLCRDARRTLSADDGTFSFTMKGSDTYEGGSHNAATFTLSSALPAHGDQLTGPDTTESFKIQVPDLHVPDVAFWQPQISYSAAAATGHLSWSAIPASLGDRPTFEAEFEDPAGNLVWALPGLSSPATIDARLLEDHDGGVAVHARPHQVGVGTVINFDYRSPGVIFRGSAGAPMSRQRACFITVPGQPPVRQRPCTLTDGDLGTAFQPQDGCIRRTQPSPGATPCPAAEVDAPYIDLGAPVVVELVAIHGCSSSCLIDTSLDAQRWSAAGGHQPTDAGLENGLGAYPLTPAPRARFLRVTGRGARLTEISVWGPPGQALPPPTEPALGPRPALSTGGHAATVALSDSQFRLVILLNVFGLLVIGAVVTVLVRRRTTRAAAR